MKKYFSYFIIICCILLMQGCPMDSEYRWYCNNQTNNTLCVYLALGCHSSYPDTILPSNTSIDIMGVLPSKKQMIYMSHVEPHKIIENLPKDTVAIFIIHQDTLLKYSWFEIRDQYMILKRYDLSLADLQRLEFSIPYPPDERMKNMKMYPSYGN